MVFSTPLSESSRSKKLPPPFCTDGVEIWKRSLLQSLTRHLGNMVRVLTPVPVAASLVQLSYLLELTPLHWSGAAI